MNILHFTTSSYSSFFFNDTATTEIYTLSLHDALPICLYLASGLQRLTLNDRLPIAERLVAHREDRKSTRLNSSHQIISYAVFCLKKKTNTQTSHSGDPATPVSSTPRLTI